MKQGTVMAISWRAPERYSLPALLLFLKRLISGMAQRVHQMRIPRMVRMRRIPSLPVTGPEVRAADPEVLVTVFGRSGGEIRSVTLRGGCPISARCSSTIPGVTAEALFPQLLRM